MTDPVTTAATGTALDAGKTVITESGGFISNFFGSLFKAPMGVLKGIFGNTIGNLWGMLTTGGIFAALRTFAPTFLDWIPLEIGGKRLSQIVKESEDKDGTLGLAKTSALVALVINGGVGAVKGGAGAVDKSVGGFAGGAVIATALGALAVNILGKDVGFAGAADHSAPKQPDPTPGKAENTKAIGT